MQSPLRYLMALCLIVSIVSCKKENETNDENTTHAEEQSLVAQGMDGVSNELNEIIEANTTFGSRGLNIVTVCNATATSDTMSNPRKITVVFNGLNCSATHFRTGTIILSMPATSRWRDAGAVLTVQYQNFKIRRVSDNKSITLNGTKTITNVTGGKLSELSGVDSIVHSINSSNMSVTFDDATVRSWNIARQRKFHYNSGIVITITGTHSTASQNNIAEWGTTRMGAPFVTTISQPVTVRQDCMFRITSGEVQHHGLSSQLSVRYGLDASGNPTACPGTGHYYFKVTYTGAGGATMSKLVAY